MTEELEQKAEEYASDVKGIDMTCTLLSAKDKQHAYILGRYEGYITGATDNGIQWHDLRKDPNDLPKIKQNKSFYLVVCETKIYEIASFTVNTFFAEGYDITKDVIAWCEIPQFKE